MDTEQIVQLLLKFLTWLYSVFGSYTLNLIQVLIKILYEYSAKYGYQKYYLMFLTYIVNLLNSTTTDPSTSQEFNRFTMFEIYIIDQDGIIQETKVVSL